MMTERAKFSERHERRLSRGLVDTRLTLARGASLTADEVMAASNRLDDAVESGRCIRMTEWQKDVTPRPVLL